MYCLSRLINTIFKTEDFKFSTVRGIIQDRGIPCKLGITSFYIYNLEQDKYIHRCIPGLLPLDSRIEITCLGFMGFLEHLDLVYDHQNEYAYLRY